MRTLLHIIANEGDSLTEEIIDAQRRDSGNRVVVMDLTAGKGEPDYRALVEAIFEADSVQVW